MAEKQPQDSTTSPIADQEIRGREGGGNTKGHSTDLAPAVHLPRVTIRYCTQCKWMLRAAYFAQELLSTFSTGIGEVALIPATGGIFTVSILHPETQETLLWNRKTEGGFPETKQLKALVRNIIDPSRDLGHVDRALAKQGQQPAERSTTSSEITSKEKDPSNKEECEDCK